MIDVPIRYLIFVNERGPKSRRQMLQSFRPPRLGEVDWGNDNFSLSKSMQDCRVKEYRFTVDKKRTTLVVFRD